MSERKATDSSRLRLIADWLDMDGLEDATEFLRRLAGDLERAQPAGEAEPVGYIIPSLVEALAKGNSVVMWPKRMGQATMPLYAAPPAAANQAGIPEGWKLVPKEPTREMLLAAYERNHDGTTTLYHKMWAAMLAAAPHTTEIENE